jgi:RNA polymerase sigma-70 factor (ECF subfamily)
VLLRDQDRSRWDRALIAEGHAIVLACIRRDRPGPFQLQAAIQAVHGAAASFAETDWEQILALYDHLHALLPTPVVALNRAIARGEVEGPESALEDLDSLAPALDGYHLLHAARGAALSRLQRPAAAADAYRMAASLASTGPERRHLEQRAAELEPWTAGPRGQ